MTQLAGDLWISSDGKSDQLKYKEMNNVYIMHYHKRT